MNTFGELREKVARGGYDGALGGSRAGGEARPGDLIRSLASGGLSYYRDLREVLQASIGRLGAGQYEAVYEYLQETSGKGGYAGMTNGAQKLANLLGKLGIGRFRP